MKKTLADLGWFNAEDFKNYNIGSCSPKQLGIILDHFELRAICHSDKRFSSDNFLNISGDEAAFDGTEEAEEHADRLISYPKMVSSNEMARLLKNRLQYRQQQWHDIWPFTLEISNRGQCTVTFQAMHPNAKAYTYFLLALYAKYIHSKAEANTYRALFEGCCFHLAKRLFPEEGGWVVKRSGAGADGMDAYTGNQNEKLAAISKDLYLCQDNSGQLPSSSGDGGIDLVVFHQLYDNRGNLPVVFMQCACSCDVDELERKTWDVCHTRLKNRLKLDVMHEWFLFSPYDWFDSIQPNRFVCANNDAVIFDRGRILKSMHKLGVDVVLSEAINGQVSEFINAQENFI